MVLRYAILGFIPSVEPPARFFSTFQMAAAQRPGSRESRVGLRPSKEADFIERCQGCWKSVINHSIADVTYEH
jgi:hypothetical protein